MTEIDAGVSLRDGKPFSVGGQDMIEGTPATEPDSWSRAFAKTGRYFDPGKAQQYQRTKVTLAADLDYGPVTTLVEDVRSIRKQLASATAARSKAAQRTVVDAADARDKEEVKAARRAGRSHPGGKHGAAARAAVNDTDMDAALVLDDAEDAERRLTATLTEHALDIRSRNDAGLADDYDEAEQLRARLVHVVHRITERQRQLGDFEKRFVAPQLDPKVTFDARPPDAPYGWRAPEGSPHGLGVRDMVASGRELALPRGLNWLADDTRHTLGEWLRERPLPAAWQPDT